VPFSFFVFCEKAGEARAAVVRDLSVGTGADGDSEIFHFIEKIRHYRAEAGQLPRPDAFFHIHLH